MKLPVSGSGRSAHPLTHTVVLIGSVIACYLLVPVAAFGFIVLPDVVALHETASRLGVPASWDEVRSQIHSRLQAGMSRSAVRVAMETVGPTRVEAVDELYDPQDHRDFIYFLSPRLAAQLGVYDFVYDDQDQLVRWSVIQW